LKSKKLMVTVYVETVLRFEARTEREEKWRKIRGRRTR
jgi:hypothetical protein